MLSRKEGFGKAFSRVKQKVDQNLGRAEATKPLNDDSVEAEKRISNVQKAMERFNKATKEFSDHNAKPPEDILVKSFQKNGETLGQHRDLGDIWLGAANVEKQLAGERENLQSIIKSTIDDRCRHVEEQLGNVRRMRKDLDNYVLDMDAARRRYLQLMRQQGNNPNALSYGGQQSSHGADASWSSNNSASPQPPDFSAEVAAAWLRVECARDSLEAEMNEIIAHEYEYGEVVIQFLEQQAAYHERSFRILKSVIPSLRERLDDSVHRPVFGLALSDHLRLWRRRTALVIEYCCLHLLKFGKTEEGLFRIAAGASKIRRLKSKFNSGQLNAYQWPPLMPQSNQMESSGNLTDSNLTGASSITSSSPDYVLPPTDPNELSELDVHALAGVLKQYLRELPDPLLTSALCEEWNQAATLPEGDRLVVVQALLSRLPPENYENLRYLVHFLSLLTQFSDQNKMTPGNVGIVIGPSIMPSSARLAENVASAAAIGANVQMTQPAIILQTFIEHVDMLFPGRTAFKPETTIYLYNSGKTTRSTTQKGSMSPKAPSNYRTLSPPVSKDPTPRRLSNCGSFDGVIDGDQSVPDDSEEYIHEEDQRRWSNALPASGAFLNDKKCNSKPQPEKSQLHQNDTAKLMNGPSSSYHPLRKDGKLQAVKKTLGPQGPGSLGSPRIVKAVMQSISHRSHSSNARVKSNDINLDASDNLRQGFRGGKSEQSSHPHESRSYATSDMEITSGSSYMPNLSNDSATQIYDEENYYDEDEELTVAVMDTSIIRRPLHDQSSLTPQQVPKEAGRADAALQRVIRAEVRRMKSKEARNKFFTGDTSSSLNDTPRQQHTMQNGDVSVNASISVPSIPRNVLIFPPVSDPNQNTTLSYEKQFERQTSPHSSSTNSVAAAPDQQVMSYRKLAAPTSMLPGYSSGNVIYSCKDNNVRRTSMQCPSSSEYLSCVVDHDPYEPAPKDTNCHGKHGVPDYNNIESNRRSREDSAIRRATVLDRCESAELPEHIGGQLVPSHDVNKPQAPPPPVPSYKMSSLEVKSADVSRNSSNASSLSVTPSSVQPTFLPAFAKQGSDTNDGYVNLADKPVQRSLDVSNGGAPALPRRKAPVAPPQAAPPPPPPTSPPAGVVPQHHNNHMQQSSYSSLPAPLIPSPVAHSTRPHHTKIVAVSQTTPSGHYDPTVKTAQPTVKNDSMSDSSDMIVTSL